MRKGFFISFEGGDGSGKTTQIRLLKEYIAGRGVDVVTVREPGGVPVSEKIREIILDSRNTDMDNITEMLLYAASRAQLVSQVIIPAMNDGKCVICDRFVDSSYVYQGIARGLGIDMIKTVNDIATRKLVPDITFFIDVEPENALKRRLNTTEPDRLEREDISFHLRVYQGYIKIAEMYPDRIKRIDGSLKEEEVFLQIKRHIDHLFCRYKY